MPNFLFIHTPVYKEYFSFYFISNDFISSVLKSSRKDSGKKFIRSKNPDRSWSTPVKILFRTIQSNHS